MVAVPNDIYAASFLPESHSQPILIITADNTQDLEFFYPYYRFIEAGYHVDVATPKGGEFKGKMGMGLKETKALRNIAVNQYQLLYIPGGKAPALLMNNDEALAITRAFAQSQKPIAAICHGAQLLAAAGVIDGQKIAAWPDVEPQITEAGGIFVNKPTVVDGQFITARWPGDLPQHMAHTLHVLDVQESEARGQLRRTAKG